jgi:hypothetical protein
MSHKLVLDNNGMLLWWLADAPGECCCRNKAYWTHTVQWIRSRFLHSLQTRLLHFITGEGERHILYYMGKRFTAKHLAELALTAQLRGYYQSLEKGDSFTLGEIELTGTHKESLAIDQHGGFWFHAIGEADHRGDCDECGGDVFHIMGDEMRCSSCGAQYYYCASCGDTLTNRSYCTPCEERIESERDEDEDEDGGSPHRLHSYSYRPSLVFYGHDSKRPGLFFGHEIEMVSNGRDLVSDLTTRREIYCKRDGSLDSNGLEVVTHPMSYDHSLQVLHFISETAKANRSKAHTAGCSCGHHIHTPTTAWSDYAIHRALGSMSLPAWRDILIFISQRETHQLMQWASPTQLSKEAAARIAKRKCGAHDLGRYTAINVGSETIEFRLFRSNIYAERLIKNMQFVLVTWHIAHSLLPFSRETLLEVCKQHHYLELLSFVKNRSKTLEQIRKSNPLALSLGSDL